MSTFRPPADPDRCRAIVLIGGQRGRCRGKRCRELHEQGFDLCPTCRFIEVALGMALPRVPEPKESQP